MPGSGGTRSSEGKSGGVRRYTPWQGKCAQYVTKGGQRVPCDRPCKVYYCEKHGGGRSALSSTNLEKNCRQRMERNCLEETR